MEHNLDTMTRIAQDVAAGREPDETYTKQMRAMWHQMDSELDVARRQNPQVYFGFPTDVDGMPDAPPGGRTDDFDESQHPRDEDGKFAPAGGAAPNTGERKAAAIEKRKNARAANLAKRKAELGTTNFNKEQGEKKAAALAKRAANLAAKKEAKEKAEAKHQAFVEGDRAAKAAAGYKYWEQEDRAKAAVAKAEQEAREALREGRRAPGYPMGSLAADLRDEKILKQEQYKAAKEEMRAQPGYESRALTGPGQEKLPGINRSADADAKELHDRLAENLKANAKLGEHARPEHEVEAEVRAAHEQVKVERAQAEQKAQAAAAERAAKAAARKEADAQLAAARDAKEQAEERERQAIEHFRGLGGVSGMTDQLAGAHQELKEAKRAALAAADKEMDAQARRAALGADIISRDSGPGGREELDRLTPQTGKYLGGGANGTYKVTLEDGTKATWKPVDGEEYGLRGNIKQGTYYLREAAMSRVAPILGVQDLVPASVAKEGHWATDKDGKEYGQGALNAWADGKTIYDYPGSVELDRAASERMRVADFVAGSTDRHIGNVVVGEQDGKHIPIMIDNGLSFPNGVPGRFIQPWEFIPKTESDLLPSTHAQIKAIDTPKLARELHAAGIEREATEHAVMRAEFLKQNPKVLSIGRSDAGKRDYAWQSYTKLDYDSSIRDRAAKITEEAYK